MALNLKQLDYITERGNKFALRYTIPLLLFKNKSDGFKTATGVVIETNSGPVLTTNAHVFEEFLLLKEKGRLQIGVNGYVLKNVSNDRFKISKKHDFGILKLEHKDIVGADLSILPKTKISDKPVETDDLITYVGFPGVLKKMLNDRNCELIPISFVATVTTVEPDQFSIRVDSEKYDWEGSDNLADRFTELGGISGAPVFALHKIRKSLSVGPNLVGWIYEGTSWTMYNQKHFAIRADQLLNFLDFK